MIDIIPLAGMLFSLLMVLIIGGFILMFPLTRRLGKLLELRIQERRESALPAEEVAALREAVAGLQDQLERLADRQAFTERLLETGRPERGSAEPRPVGSVPGPGAGEAGS
ncbi:MAG: hypothetical protein ACOCVZ_05800 [Gemmatimonadota bacterium]